MNKNIRKIMFFILIIILGYAIYFFSIKSHHCIYKINGYKIYEYFYKEDKHVYDFIIKKKKISYTFSIKKNLNKKKKIIRKVKTYKNEDLICIIPIYKKSIQTNIYCNLNNEQVSIDYLLKTSNESFSKIQAKMKKYKIIYPKEEIYNDTYKKIKVYNKNILDNDIYFIWDYKGIYILSKNKNNYKKILDYDLYDNVTSCIADKYYIIFENTSVNGIKKIYYYDFKRNKLKVYKPEKILSKDTYINGVVDNIIYVTDNKERKQYTIDIRKKKIEELSFKTNNYIIYNNKRKRTINKNEFFQKQQLFQNNVEENYTYFKQENKIYKRLNKSKSGSILLLKLDGIKEWSLIADEIILLQDNAIYSYTEEKGLRKIIENNELRYNYKNIYQVEKK